MVLSKLIFGSYKQIQNGINKIWSQITVDIGGEFIKGNFWESYHMDILLSPTNMDSSSKGKEMCIIIDFPI